MWEVCSEKCRPPSIRQESFMGKDKKRDRQEELNKQVNYYKLNTKAVKDLVEADESNSPEVSEEELRYYRSGPRFKMADWVKLVFIKFWFPACVCFFFIWGLGGYVGSLMDMLFITGIALGMVTDLLTNPMLRFFERTPGANSFWMMFPKKGYASFPLNILYSFVVLFFVFTAYNIINMALIAITGAVDTIPLGVGPVGFGLIYLGFDLLFINMKHMAANIIHDAMKKPVS